MTVISGASYSSMAARSRYSRASAMHSTAGQSMCLGDFNGKKNKIIVTLRGIDELRSGLCKSDVFYNLLNCLDVEVADEDRFTIRRKFEVAHQGVNFIKYQDVLKALRYDNHSEKWTIACAADDQMISPRYRGSSMGNITKGDKLRGSYDQASRLNANELKKAFGKAATSIDVLNETAAVLSNANEDVEAAEIVPSRRSRTTRRKHSVTGFS